MTTKIDNWVYGPIKSQWYLIKSLGVYSYDPDSNDGSPNSNNPQYLCLGDRMIHRTWGEDHHLNWRGSYSNNWHGGPNLLNLEAMIEWLKGARYKELGPAFWSKKMSDEQKDLRAKVSDPENPLEITSTLKYPFVHKGHQSIPTAKEMISVAKNALRESVLRQIKEAASNGRFYATVYCIPPEVEEELVEAGFSVRYNEATYNFHIAWKDEG